MMFTRYKICNLVKLSVNFMRTNPSIWKSKHRYLFSSASIGLDDFLVNREKVGAQFKDIGDKFREKMHEFADPSNDSIIFTEDLKQVIHLVEDRDDDIQLVEKMLLKFAKQYDQMRFGCYIFGPVVMRMLYYLDRPKEALSLFKNKDVQHVFDQLSSHLILMDLLFNREMYAEVLEVYESLRDKQMLSGKYPKGVMALVFAACYKMNTAKSYEYTKELWKDMQVSGSISLRRTTCFAAALAVKQNCPHDAWEMIYTIPKQNYILVRCIKILALTNLNRVEDTIPILRSVLTLDSPRYEKQLFCYDVIDAVREVIQLSDNKELQMEFSRIERQLKDQGHISLKSLDEELCSEIVVAPKTSNTLEATFTKDEGVRRTNKPIYRNPGLADMF